MITSRKGQLTTNLLSEVAKAKAAVQGFKSAQERNNRAITAWQSFFNGYHAAHPELPGMQFTSDFRFAFTRKNGNAQFPWEAEAVTIELSPEERQKAESLYREMLEAMRGPTKLDVTGRTIGMNSCSTTSQRAQGPRGCLLLYPAANPGRFRIRGLGASYSHQTSVSQSRVSNLVVLCLVIAPRESYESIPAKP